jgi:hypothetical protein
VISALLTAPVLTSLVLDAAAATCLTRKTIRLLVVLSVAVRAVLLKAMMPAAIAPGANPIFHLMMQHLNAAVSSRIYPDEHRSTRGLDARHPDAKSSAGGMSEDQVFLNTGSRGIFDRCFQHQCITPH